MQLIGMVIRRYDMGDHHNEERKALVSMWIPSANWTIVADGHGMAHDLIEI